MHDVRWKELGVAHTYISHIYWEKCDGKTAGLSNLNHRMLIQAKKCKYTSNFSRAIFFKLCARCAKTLPPDVTHMMNFTRIPHFSVYIVEKLGGASGRG